MVRVVRIQSKKIWRLVDIIDNDIDIAVVIEVAEGTATTGLRSGCRLTQNFCDIFEFSVLQIAVNHLALFVGGLRLELVHLGIDVTVGQEEVQPAAVIQVDEATTPPQPPGVKPNSS